MDITVLVIIITTTIAFTALCLKSYIENLINDRHALEVENAELRMKNKNLESDASFLRRTVIENRIQNSKIHYKTKDKFMKILSSTDSQYLSEFNRELYSILELHEAIESEEKK